MPATFQIIIDSIRTASDGDLTEVIKHVSWNLKGTQGDQIFVLPQETSLGPVDPENFIPLSSLTTPDQVIAWVEAASTNMEATKAHIQLVLDAMCAKAELVNTAMPWATAEESSTTPAE